MPFAVEPFLGFAPTRRGEIARPVLTDKQEQLCAESRWDFSDLHAVYINCTLKRSPGQSHTQGLADGSIAVMERNGVAVEVVRAVDHTLAPGSSPT